jgi:23S rRNA (guanosine2251-2'-O)-methyltransferase
MARLIAGIQPVREAIRAHGQEVERVFVERSESPRIVAIARHARDTGVLVEELPRGELDRLARGVHHQGVIAFAPEVLLVPLAQVVEPDAAIVLLDAVTDPQNFGATIRSAVALGSGAVVFGENQAAPLTAATFRASAGAVEHARLCRVPSLRRAVAELIASRVTVVCLEAHAPHALSAIDLRGPAAVVIGAEDRGVGRAVRDSCSARARVAMSGKLDSLNASVAAAVALYEIRRQRG